MLAGLLKIFEPLTAEKVFLTAYIVFFFLAFRYLLRARRHTRTTSRASRASRREAFFYMGFWNFIAGSVLLLFTVGYVLRRTQRWTGRSLAALTVLACLLYGTHAVPWAVGAAAVAVLCLSDSGPRLREAPGGRAAGGAHAARRSCAACCAAAPGRAGAGGRVVAAPEPCLP